MIRLLRLASEATDLLFLLTERLQFCVLAYEPESGKRSPFSDQGWAPQNPLCVAGGLVTRANGDASERIGRQVEVGQIGIVEPGCRLIGLHLYDGQLKVGSGCQGAYQQLRQSLATGWGTGDPLG